MTTDRIDGWERAHKNLVRASQRLLAPSQWNFGIPRYEDFAAEGQWDRKYEGMAGTYTLYVMPQVHMKLYDLSVEDADRVLTAWLPTVARPGFPVRPEGPERVADYQREAWYTMYPNGEIYEVNPDKHDLIWNGWHIDWDGRVSVLELSSLSVPHAQALRTLLSDPTAPGPVVIPREIRPDEEEPPFS